MSAFIDHAGTLSANFSLRLPQSCGLRSLFVLPGNIRCISDCQAAVEVCSSMPCDLQHSSQASSIVAVGPVCGGGRVGFAAATGGGVGLLGGIAAGLAGAPPAKARNCEPYFARMDLRSPGAGIFTLLPSGLRYLTLENSPLSFLSA